MAITNYTELKSAIADFLNRDDLESVIPTFISLAEANIARDLRHWRQHSRVRTTVDEAKENLPSNFIEAISLTIDNDQYLQYVPLSEMVKMRAEDDTAGKPRYFTYNTNQLDFYPTNDQNYTLRMVYVARIPALQEDEVDNILDRNWLLTNFPDVYLYGALLHSAPYLADDARSAVWAQLYGSAIAQLNMESASSIASGSRLVIK
jgi:hypothetical protein